MSTLLCKVKANYAFESNDPSSLHFKEGDIIEVLCKLPSGWWDGWCCGRRGWFPSNYVQVLQEYTLADNEKKHQLFLDPNTGEMEFKEYTSDSPQYELSLPGLTYKKLLEDITMAVHQLISATKNSDNSDYTKYATSIVHAIRFMMISTGTISKEASIIKNNHLLRTNHRIMMNALAKLVFSSQSNETEQLVIESQEILLAVRNFVNLCETMEIELCRVDPVLAFPDGQHAEPLVQDVCLLESSSDCMQKMLSTLVTQLARPVESRASLSVLLFSQYRNLATLNGQFMSLVESAHLHSLLGTPMVKELALSKQSLYAGFGMLFIKMQTLTDETVAIDNSIRQMQAIAQSVQEAVQSVGRIMSELAQEESIMGGTKRNSSALVLSDSTSVSSHSSLPEPIQYDLVKDYSIENPPDTPESIHTTTLYKKMNDAPLSPPLYRRIDDRSDGPLSPPYRKNEIPFPKTEVPPSPTVNRKLSTVTDSSQMSDEQSFLRYDYAPNEIVFSNDGQVKGGTLPALVERITLHDYFDMSFSNTFFLTYRSFCTSDEFLDLLEARFNVQPPPGLTEEELKLWRGKKQKLIRLRVLNVLKIWLEQYYNEQDYSILNRLTQFMATIRDANTFSATQIDRLIQKRKASCKDIKSLVMTQTSDAPEPILPRNLKRLRIMDISPTEMARQLTLIDFKLYSSIQPIECLDKAWSREDEVSAIHIQASIRFCNGMTQWVTDEILSQPEIKKRSLLLKYWVDVAERCRQWNNFNTCMAIMSAFDNSAIGRLKRTWEMVGGRTHQVVIQLRNLLKANRNFVQYRELLHSINPPCVPFVGIYLQDLTFIEDGNSNFLKPPYAHLINFAKRTKTATVIQEIQQYQMTCYQFRPVEAIQEFINNNMGSSRDEDQLYKESLKLEPKERDDEKITRLLYESGFL
ncbi:hypothetical protein CU098_011230 [Rhizopus stolonifer]|uniref:Ras GEF n=1 Tax=Rhizopus stolonifer TaxID=4846 RepID=A0A367KVE8_RHIST|nr:hypothetical protein CU098_011230 [Rhizopus stolonifer]